MRQLYQHYLGGIYELIGVYSPDLPSIHLARNADNGKANDVDESKGWRVLYAHVWPYDQQRWHRDPHEFFGVASDPSFGHKLRFRPITEDEYRYLIAQMPPEMARHQIEERKRAKGGK